MSGEAPGLALAIERGLAAGFPERAATAQLFAELLLDAVDAALPLTRGPAEPAAEALAQLELLATGADLYSWEGAPGWDEVLVRGLSSRTALLPGVSVLDGLGQPNNRREQRAELFGRARAEAVRLVELGRELAQAGTAAALVGTHASLVRLFGLAAAAPLFELPEDPQAGALEPSRIAEAALVAEMDARAQAGSEFAAAGEEWLGRLLTQNPAASHPAFRRFFAGLSQTLRVSLTLRELRDQALSGALPHAASQPQGEVLLGTLGGYQPVRWQELRQGAPAGWLRLLCPPAPEAEAPLERLARESSCALDLAGRLWLARDFSLTAFTALFSLFTARCASLIALWEELGGTQLLI